MSSSTSLSRRLSVLENHSDGAGPFVAIMQRVGQSQEEARADHEAKHGPIPQGSDIMFIRLVGVKPQAA